MIFILRLRGLKKIGSPSGSLACTSVIEKLTMVPLGMGERAIMRTLTTVKPYPETPGWPLLRLTPTCSWPAASFVVL